MNAFKPATEKCPKCTDGYLLERVNGTTKNTFLGCSEFPDCEFTKPGGSNPSPARVSEPYCDCFDPWDDPYDPFYDMDPGDMF